MDYLSAMATSSEGIRVFKINWLTKAGWMLRLKSISHCRLISSVKWIIKPVTLFRFQKFHVLLPTLTQRNLNFYFLAWPSLSIVCVLRKQLGYFWHDNMIEIVNQCCTFYEHLLTGHLVIHLKLSHSLDS